ncbi:MAG: type IV pilus secretin PilQ [Deltaproteobacteria bacterium]|nr:type IV pilus secretin PilQ [Deltaproteobacteria bacterium]
MTTIGFRHKVASVWLLIIVIVFWSIGCSGTKTNKSDNPFFDQWREAAEKNKGYSPSKKKTTPGVSEKRISGLDKDNLKGKAEKPLPTKRVTVRLRELEVSTALRAIAKAADQNIVINEAIKGTVTIDVKNTPWDQVFLGILRTNALAYAWEGDILRVITAEEKAKENKEIVKTLVVPIEFADLKQIRENIQNVLTKSETRSTDGGKAQNIDQKTGSVLMDEYSNSLIIQASLEDLQRLIPVIEALDRPTSQILIESHIVEATKDTARQLGVQWGGLYHANNQWIYPGANSSTGIAGQTISSTTTYPVSGVPSAAQNGVIGMGVGAPTGGYTGNMANFPASFAQSTASSWGLVGLTLGYMVGLGGDSLLSAQLSALATDGKLNILSNPSVTTLDNSKAFIESGKNVPFQTVDKNGNISIYWQKATLKLEVTPHVIDGKILKMKINTQKDELDFTNTVQGNPTIITKNAETNVILSDGETTVIGGLNKETTQDSENGIPGLKDIPYLGWLFRNTSNSKNMEEILIFITPYILPCQDPAGGDCRKVKLSEQKASGN